MAGASYLLFAMVVWFSGQPLTGLAAGPALLCAVGLGQWVGVRWLCRWRLDCLVTRQVERLGLAVVAEGQSWVEGWSAHRTCVVRDTRGARWIAHGWLSARCGVFGSDCRITFAREGEDEAA